MGSFADDNYKMPVSSSAYTRFEQGNTKLRVIGKIFTGWEYFNTDNKAVRQKEEFEGIPEDAKEDTYNPGQKAKPKHFRAFKAWNYGTERVEVCQINKKGILKSFLEFIDNPEYGDADGYDITIKKSGVDKATKYVFQPSPPKALGADIQALSKEVNINIEALFDGGNVFEKVTKKVETAETAETAETVANDESF